MCEFCGIGGPRECAVCRATDPNLWAPPHQLPARVLVVPPDPPVTRRQDLAIWVCLVGGMAYFGLVAWAAVRLGI